MRPIRTIIIACGVATLTACSLTNNSDDNPPANPAATAESTTAQQDSEAHPPKDVTIGEMLNAGVYAPDSTAYGLFRPCGGDISLPQLQEIGWKVDSISNNQNDLENINVNRLEDITGSSFYCFLKGIPGKQLGSGHLSVNYKSYEEVTQLEGVRETREDLNKLNVKRPAGYYIHDAESSTTNSDKVQRCSAGVMTKRGRITFDYQSPFTDTSTTGKEKVCQTAVDSLQTILDMPITAAPAANPAPEPAPAPESETPTTPVKPAAHAVAAGPELKFQPSPGFSSHAPAPQQTPANPEKPEKPESPAAPAHPTDPTQSPQTTSQPQQPADPTGSEKPENSQVPTFAKVLGVGEYKPQDKLRGSLGIFNACEEISAEQWKSLGLVPFDDPKLGSAKDVPPYYSCFYRTGDSDKEFQEMLVAESTFNPLEGQMKHMTPLDHIKVNKPENFYLIDSPNAKEKQCSVGVVTSRGRFTLNYGNKIATESISKEEACQRVVDKMQAILALKYEPPAEKTAKPSTEKAAPESAPKAQSPSDAPAGSNTPETSEAPKAPESTPESAPSTSGA
ncbi:Uncharacterised protein [Corynebacterium matruchotii]|uniref:hypothetical protein n=1 Tax=Corynebacterium matruchotii TaxID=43768 RepID=UPI000F708ABB|nr:hypothetical protein [Corynebacterium matruchotii]VEI99139.1 Uncharacterised protein [Corynebacterium matruchotii]